MKSQGKITESVVLMKEKRKKMKIQKYLKKIIKKSIVIMFLILYNNIGD